LPSLSLGKKFAGPDISFRVLRLACRGQVALRLRSGPLGSGSEPELVERLELVETAATTPGAFVVNCLVCRSPRVGVLSAAAARNGLADQGRDSRKGAETPRQEKEPHLPVVWLVIRLPPFACPNLPTACPRKIESGAAEAFAALDRIAMLGGCGSEDEPWGRRMEASE
jgi:hypothetical protein